MAPCEALSGLPYRKKHYWYKTKHGLLKIALKNALWFEDFVSFRHVAYDATWCYVPVIILIKFCILYFRYWYSDECYFLWIFIFYHQKGKIEFIITRCTCACQNKDCNSMYPTIFWTWARMGFFYKVGEKYKSSVSPILILHWF